MAIRLKDAIDILVEKSTSYERPELATYRKDADEITWKIVEGLREANSVFLPEFEDLKTTGLFWSHPFPQFRVPVLWVKMKYQIEDSGLAIGEKIPKLKLKSNVLHSAADAGQLNGENMNMWFNMYLNEACENLQNFGCKSGNRYKVTSGTTLQDKRLFFTITASQYIGNGFNKTTPIFYHFILGYKFLNDDHCYSYSSDGFAKFSRPVDISKPHRLAQMLAVVGKLLMNLNINPPVAVDAAYRVMSFSTEFSEILMEAIRLCVPFASNPRDLSAVHIKMLNWKKDDAVVLSELLELFSIP